MNRDYLEMLHALSEASADFLVVGAHALAAHGVPRATGDLDLWVRPTPENAMRVWHALQIFGAPLHDLTLDDLSKPGVVFQIGVVPCRIDILTQISGVDFAPAWDRRVTVEIDGLPVGFLSREDFIANKSATGRKKDLLDLALLSSDE